MVTCDNFVTFMVDDDPDLEGHARSCDECGRVLLGYRAFVAHREARRAGLLPEKEARPDRVKDVVLRAAREAIASRARAAARRRARNRALALAAASVVLLALGIEIVRLLDPGTPDASRTNETPILGITPPWREGESHDRPKR